MSCTGPCRQGRDPCPTPEACYEPERDGGMGLIAMLFIYIMGIATGVFAALILC